MTITRRSFAAVAALSPLAVWLDACTRGGQGVFDQSPIAGVTRLGTPPADAAAVAAELLAQIGAGEAVCSPHGLRLAFLLAYAGAAGQTAQEMRTALRLPAQEQLSALRSFPASTADGPTLEIASAVWPDARAQLRPEYVTLVRQMSGAQVRTLDYRDAAAAAANINGWVAHQTHDRIHDLVTAEALQGALLVLTSAIYLHARWEVEFERAGTAPRPFHVSAGETIQTDMMAGRGSRRHMAGDGLAAVDLPYAGGDLVMTVLLPDSVDGLADLQRRAAGGGLGRWLAALGGATAQPVDVVLPRFRTETSLDLTPAMRAMGVALALGDHADFSPMARTPLKISSVVQKAFISVDEKGTEAAAATAIEEGDTAALEEAPPVVFNADHPFLYLIRDLRDGSVLFAGRVERPTAPPRA